jgi:hypothetical protein
VGDENDRPRFKGKKNPVQSYTTKHTNGNIAVEGNQMKLPKLGWVRFAKSREMEGRILSATIAAIHQVITLYPFYVKWIFSRCLRSIKMSV